MKEENDNLNDEPKYFFNNEDYQLDILDDKFNDEITIQIQKDLEDTYKILRNKLCTNY